MKYTLILSSFRNLHLACCKKQVNPSFKPVATNPLPPQNLHLPPKNHPLPNQVTIHPTNDHALTIQLGDTINLITHQKVLSLFQYLQQHPFAGLIDIIPAYNTLTVVYDPIIIKHLNSELQTAAHWVETHIKSILPNFSQQAAAAARQLKVPVCYHPSLAPDIEALAQQHNLTIREVIHLHTTTTYNVYMLGFLPGFPYMASVHERLATPRKPSPRKNVPAGSVGIAGNQTGIYPFASPGGWQIIGQTPLTIFDAAKQDPAFFQPGDSVQFYAITIDEFHQTRQP